MSALGTADAAAQWSTRLAAGGRLDAAVDPDRISRARRWNTASLLVGCLIGVPLVAFAVFLIVRGVARESLIAVIALLVGVVLALFVPRMVRLRRTLTGSGRGVGVGAAGVDLPGSLHIAWRDILGIVLYDDSARTRVATSVPIFGWGSKLALRAGEGRVGVTIGLRDGTAVRAGMSHPAHAKSVRLWGDRRATVRPGDITLTLDAIMDAATVAQVGAALRGGAMLCHVPVHTPRTAIEYATTIATVVDPTVLGRQNPLPPVE